MKHTSRLTTSLYGMLLARGFVVDAWGPIFEPMKGGWGRVRTVLHVLHREYDEDEPDHDGNSSRMPLPYASHDPVLPDKLVLSPETLIFHNPLLWEPTLEYSDDDERDEIVVLDEHMLGTLGDCGDECDLACDIPDDFRHVDDTTLAQVVDFLGIQRAQPVQTPKPTRVDKPDEGEWE